MSRTGDAGSSIPDLISSRSGRVLLALFVTTVISYLDRYILALLASPLKQDLGLSDTDIGLLQGLAFTVLYALASLPAGYLSDKISRKRIIIFGVVCWSLGTLCCGLASDFTELFVARMAVGFGEATLGPAAISLISVYFDPSRRGRAIGIYQLGACVGGGASLLLGGLLLAALKDASIVNLPIFGDTASWRIVFAIFGIIGLAWAPFILLIHEPARQVPASAAAIRGNPAYRFKGLAVISAIYVAYAAASFLNSGLVAWAPSMYVREFGISTSQTGILTGLLTTVAVAFGCLLSGYWGDFSTRRRSFAGKLRVTIFAFMIAVPSVFAFAAASSFTVSIIAYGLALFAGGLMLASAPAVLSDVLPAGRQGLGMSIYFFNVAFFGLTLGPLSVGIINDTLYAGEGLQAAIFYALGVAVVFGLIVSLLVARSYHGLLKSRSGHEGGAGMASVPNAA